VPWRNRLRRTTLGRNVANLRGADGDAIRQEHNAACHWVGLALLAVTVLLAACGGGAGPGVASIGSTTTTMPDGGTAGPSPFAGVTQEYGYAVSYAEYMRTHGVAGFPIPTKSSRGFSFNPTADSNSPHFSSANAACKHLLPDNGGPPTAMQIAAETARKVKYARCMRAHGESNFPDPTDSKSLFGFRMTGVDPKSPQFKAAQKACASIGASAGF
jgi:hypothetical protein